ncbi:MAG TPA: hypothetical protein VN253_06305 [Kofleriaceae bacterium]|nr:hypothetical protein [Kofleriaceae bacterium]
MRVRAIAAAAALSACGSFEREDVVLDTRVLAMAASVPDQIVDVDFDHPPQPAELLGQLVPSEMCALVADPGRDRRLRWSMTLCVLDTDQRCDSKAKLLLASSVAPDPDTTIPAPRLCATISPDGNLLGVLLEALEGDTLRGLGGIDYGISLVVGGEDEDPAGDLFAGKRLRVAPRIPAGRRANQNPTLRHLEATIDDGAPFMLPQGRCIDQAAPTELRAGQTMRLLPVEPEGAREVYVVPRLDGAQETFTESLTYQWLATAGSFTKGSTGGPRDVSGNPPPLFTDYRAPKAKDLTGPTDVPLWVVQRDERLGAAWYESCVRVVP